MARQTWTRVIVASWLIGLAFATHSRVHVWQSDLNLWKDAYAKAPLKPRSAINYGRTLELAGDVVTAEDLYRKVIWLSFDERRSAYVRRFSQAAAETNIAHLYMKDGRLASAMKILDGTLTEWPEFPYAHYNKGAILWVYGACEDAREEYRLARAWDPSLPGPQGQCGPLSFTP